METAALNLGNKHKCTKVTIYSPSNRNCGSTSDYCGETCNANYGSCSSLSGAQSSPADSPGDGAPGSGTGSAGTSPSSNSTANTLCLDSNGDAIGTAYCSARKDLQCYALPYGLLGFISDMLTLYTVFMISIGKRPWFPREDSEGGWPNFAMSLASFLGTSVTTISTMHNCFQTNRTWQFIPVAAWKLSSSLCLNIITGHAALVFGSIGRKKIPWS